MHKKTLSFKIKEKWFHGRPFTGVENFLKPSSFFLIDAAINSGAGLLVWPRNQKAIFPQAFIQIANDLRKFSLRKIGGIQYIHRAHNVDGLFKRLE